MTRVQLPEWFGGELVFDKAGGRDFILRLLQTWGWHGFERPLPDVFLAHAERWPGLVVDVGANTGFYSVLALAASPNNTVIAFEPDPAVLPLLRRNLRLNRARSRARILPEAASDTFGRARLYVPEQDHGLVETSSSLEPSFMEKHGSVLDVRSTTIDSVLAGGRAPTLIKVDVEGHERAVLAGSQKVLSRSRSTLVVELLENANYAWFTAFRDSLGYRSVRLRAEEALIEDPVCWDPEAWTHVFVGPERWDSFLDMLRVRGLTISGSPDKP